MLLIPYNAMMTKLGSNSRKVQHGESMSLLVTYRNISLGYL